MKAKGPEQNGWQLASLIARTWVAARTWARIVGLFTARASCARLRSFQAGVIIRKAAGSAPRSGVYQATPKPSPLSGSARSSLA